MGDLIPLVLTPIRQSGYWRVKMVWPNHNLRYSADSFLDEKLRDGSSNIVGLLVKVRSAKKGRPKRLNEPLNDLCRIWLRQLHLAPACQRKAQETQTTSPKTTTSAAATTATGLVVKADI